MKVVNRLQIQKYMPHRCSECNVLMAKSDHDPELYECGNCGNTEIIQLKRESTHELDTFQPFTPPEKNHELVSSDETNPPYNIIIDKKLILLNDSNLEKMEPNVLREILSFHASIMSVKARRKVYFYFLDNQAATAPLITLETDLTVATVYRQIKWLHGHGWLHAHAKVKSYKKGGPRPVLYALPGTDSEVLARTMHKVRKSQLPTYHLVKEIVQLCWEDIRDMEIQMSKITWFAKQNGKQFHFMGIADLVALELKSKGVKVWRKA